MNKKSLILLQKLSEPFVRSDAVIGFLAVGQTIDVANNGFHSYYILLCLINPISGKLFRTQIDLYKGSFKNYVDKRG